MPSSRMRAKALVLPCQGSRLKEISLQNAGYGEKQQLRNNWARHQGNRLAFLPAWDWTIALASLPHAVGTTSVLFGKHIDKLQQDKKLKIHTLPVLLGETAARWTMTAMLISAYLLVIYLIWIRFFTPVMLVTLLAVPTLVEIWPILSNPKPAEKPAD
ncbi:MAG: prenyltransferase, partial [Anaerolineales bacterium]